MICLPFLLLVMAGVTELISVKLLKGISKWQNIFWKTLNPQNFLGTRFPGSDTFSISALDNSKSQDLHISPAMN